jgi:excisionase family DNA binding protein
LYSGGLNLSRNMNNHGTNFSDTGAALPPAATAHTSLPDEWLTLEEVARRLKASRTSVWRCRRDGLKAVRIGGIVRVQARDLQEFMARHRG